ncbi:DUF3696 domain-containing protein [Thiomicrorhabdus sp. Milos-T2]|uniref:DUF3696 domain-containing protein n=1 Tax=Thiomicrorhabdus sp. Milos-T2 TaxID=90814 RepID=UPI0004947756|nr:DUF3696 domain-containing protein [Thiomicrorhabdus sp. Milos-T2]
MRITQLRLENFKSFKKPTTIDFAPVTLLFGPNSAGKSSIIQAIDLMRALYPLNNHEFSDFFHNNSETMTVGLTIDIEDEGDLLESESAQQLAQYQELLELGNIDVTSIDFGYVTSLVETVGVDVTWKNSSNGFDIDESNFTILINGQNLLSFQSSNILVENAIEKSLFSDSQKPLDAENNYKVDVNELKRLCKLNGWILTDFNSNHSIFEDKDAKEVLEQLLGSFDSETNQNLDSGELVFAFSGRTPSKDMSLQFSETCWSEEVKYSFEKKLMTAFLQLLVTAPFEYIEKATSAAKHLGPLRVVPNFQAINQTFKIYDGSQAWSFLGQEYMNTHYQSLVNEWLSEENRLNSGYRIIVSEQFLTLKEASPSITYAPDGSEIDLSEFHKNNGIDSIPRDVLHEMGYRTEASKDKFVRKIKHEQQWSNIEKKMEETKVFRNSSMFSGLRPISFININNNHVTDAGSIGVGISQVLPVVVYACDKKTSFFAVEQPELHLHPRAQSPLGDLFIENSLDEQSKKTFVIETHSEHIVLRLLRRIREHVITPNHVSVLYVQNINGCSEVKELRIDDEGDFIDEWPNGFFDERDEELF